MVKAPTNQGAFTMIKKIVQSEHSAIPTITPVSADSPAALSIVELMTAPAVQQAIEVGRAIIAEGKSKSEAAQAIFAFLPDASKEVIVAAFVDGATLTPKGALTYWYNCRRKVAKAQKQD